MSWVLALLIGLVAGYGAVDGGQTGMLVAGLALVVLPLIYYRQGRVRDIGVLLIGMGALPTVILGRILLDSGGGPEGNVANGTWQLFAVACVLIVLGIGILLTTSRWRRP
ncbi:MAG: hypothetical protein WD116_02960 [Chloroflexota bacterium]